MGGSRKRKSVRGCIVGPDLATLQLAIARKGAEDIPGLTDDNRPRRLGPKRAANIRKLFNLEKKDDVKQFVVRREARKRMQVAKKLKADYTKRLSEYRQEQKELRAAEVAKKKKEKTTK